MKKSFLIISLVITTTLFFSCRNGLQGRVNSGSDDEVAYIYINAETTGRSAMLKEDSTRVDRLTNIVLTGNHSGESYTLIDTGSEQTFAELTDEDKTFKVQTGSWSFTFSATLDGVPFSKNTTKEIIAGTNTLSFYLEPDSAYKNYGGMNITVFVEKPESPEDPVLEKVIATVKTDEWKQNESEITPISTTTYDFTGEDGNQLIQTEDYMNKDDNSSIECYAINYNLQACEETERVEAGTYRLIFDFYAKGTVDESGELIPINTISYVVVVTGGYNTIESQLIKLNETYKITYNYNDENDASLEGISAAPEYYSRKTATFNLPKLIREGYDFLGWYKFDDNGNFTGNEIKQITKGSTGNITLNAKWQKYTTASGNITTDDGLFDIVMEGDTLYMNCGQLTFAAYEKDTGGPISPEIARNLTWDAVLLYKGKDINTFGNYYRCNLVEDENENLLTLNLRNSLPIPGTYQLYVKAIYKDSENGNAYTGYTSSKTFDLDITHHLFEIQGTSGSSYSEAIMSISSAFYNANGKPINMKITGNSSDDAMYLIGYNMSGSKPTDTELDFSDLDGVEELKCASGYNPNNENVSVFDGTGLRKITLPRSLKTLKSYSLACGYFDNDTSEFSSYLREVEIPDTIETIEENAFYVNTVYGGMNRIERFTIYQAGEEPNTDCIYSTINDGTILLKTENKGTANEVTTIVAVAQGSHYDTVNFSEGELANIKDIPAGSFQRMSSLKYVNFGNVETIGSNAFAFTGLQGTINLSNVKTIGAGAFTKATMSGITLPEPQEAGVVTIEDGAFSYSYITSVSVPANISLGEGPFYGCFYLTEIKFESPEYEINTNTIARCSQLKKITISGTTSKGYTTTTAGDLLLKPVEGTSNRSVVAKAPAATVTAYDFSSGELTDITSIEKEAFAVDSNFYSEDEDDNQYKLPVPLEDRIATLKPTTFEITSFGNITTIGEQAFTYSSISKIEDFGSLKNIPNSAFLSCLQLTSIPPITSDMTIDDYAFNNTGLTSLVIDSYSNNTFQNTSFKNSEDFSDAGLALTLNFEINDENMIKVHDPIMRSISGVKSIVFNQKVVLPDLDQEGTDGEYYYVGATDYRIFDYAADSLESITFNGADSVIGMNQFHNFAELKTLTFKKSNIMINQDAFYTCPSLADYIFDFDITEENAEVVKENFANLPTNQLEDKNITFNGSVILPDATAISGYDTSSDSVFAKISPKSISFNSEKESRIGAYQFHWCGVLKQLDLSGVTVIGDKAFYNACSLEEVTIPSSVYAIGNCAFYDPNNPISVTLEDSSSSWYSTTEKTTWEAWIAGTETPSGTALTTEQVISYIVPSSGDTTTATYLYKVH